MFQNVMSLKALDLSNFNTSSVTDMQQMFSGCASLVSINLNSFNTSKVTNFYHMFNGCNSLIYLNLNSFIIQDNALIHSYTLPESSVDLFLCYNITTAGILTSYLNGHSNNCDNNCFRNEAKLIIGDRECIDDCFSVNVYKIEYKKIC